MRSSVGRSRAAAECSSAAPVGVLDPDAECVEPVGDLPVLDLLPARHQQRTRLGDPRIAADHTACGRLGDSRLRGPHHLELRVVRGHLRGSEIIERPEQGMCVTNRGEQVGCATNLPVEPVEIVTQRRTHEPRHRTDLFAPFADTMNGILDLLRTRLVEIREHRDRLVEALPSHPPNFTRHLRALIQYVRHRRSAPAPASEDRRTLRSWLEFMKMETRASPGHHPFGHGTG